MPMVAFAWRALLLLALMLLPAHAAPKRLLVVGQGPDGHPAFSHEYQACAELLAALLKPHSEVAVRVVHAPEPWTEGPSLLDESEGIALFVTQGAEWMQRDPARHAALQRLARRGGALVAIHWSVGSKEGRFVPGQVDLLGGSRGGPDRKHQILETVLTPEREPHPILRGIGPIRVVDELYYRLDLKPEARPLLRAEIEGRPETVAWAWERPDGGRSFGFVGLHFHANWQIPEYRRLVLQGTLWTLQAAIPEEGAKVDLPESQLQVRGLLPPKPSPPKPPGP